MVAPVCAWRYSALIGCPSVPTALQSKANICYAALSWPRYAYAAGYIMSNNNYGYKSISASYFGLVNPFVVLLHFYPPLNLIWAGILVRNSSRETDTCQFIVGRKGPSSSMGSYRPNSLVY